jgi:hypothetical protein
MVEIAPMAVSSLPNPLSRMGAVCSPQLYKELCETSPRLCRACPTLGGLALEPIGAVEARPPQLQSRPHQLLER